METTPAINDLKKDIRELRDIAQRILIVVNGPDGKIEEGLCGKTLLMEGRLHIIENVQKNCIESNKGWKRWMFQIAGSVISAIATAVIITSIVVKADAKPLTQKGANAPHNTTQSAN